MLRLFEVWLRECAVARVAAAGDGEEAVNAAVGGVGDGRAVGVHGERETRFAHGTIRGDEKRNGIRGSAGVGGFDLRIGTDVGILSQRRAAAADGWLRMATG